jgi:hypothetical protein
VYGPLYFKFAARTILCVVGSILVGTGDDCPFLLKSEYHASDPLEALRPRKWLTLEIFISNPQDLAYTWYWPIFIGTLLKNNSIHDSFKRSKSLYLVMRGFPSKCL